MTSMPQQTVKWVNKTIIIILLPVWALLPKIIMIKSHPSMQNMILGEMVYCRVMISSGFILILRLISRRLYGVILGILGSKAISSLRISLRIECSMRIYPGVSSIRISSFTIFCLIYWRKRKFPRLFLTFY